MPTEVRRPRRIGPWKHHSKQLDYTGSKEHLITRNKQWGGGYMIGFQLSTCMHTDYTLYHTTGGGLHRDNGIIGSLITSD